MKVEILATLKILSLWNYQ